MPFGNQLLGFVIARLRRIAQRVGGVAIHHHLATDHPHVAARGLFEISLGRGFVHRAERHSRCGAVTHDQIIEPAGHRGAMFRRDKTGLFREGVIVQPIQQLIPPGGDHLHLREMHMGVDEPRHQQMRAVVHHRHAGCLGCKILICAHCCNPAPFDQQRTVFDIAIGVCVAVIQRFGGKAQHAPPQELLLWRCSHRFSHPFMRGVRGKIQVNVVRAVTGKCRARTVRLSDAGQPILVAYSAGFAAGSSTTACSFTSSSSLWKAG